MKKFFLFTVAVVLVSVSWAQKVYFIYLQSDRQQPFYARLGDKTYAANPSGYLILPLLHDSTYTLKIGVQGSSTQEQEYVVTLNKKDQGFLIKNFEDQGWGLFNLQSMAILKPASSPALSIVKTEKQPSNSFTELLAKAADDSTLKEKPVAAIVETKIPEAQIAIQKVSTTDEKKASDSNTFVLDKKIKTPAPAINEESREEIKDTSTTKKTDPKLPQATVERKGEFITDMKTADTIQTNTKPLIAVAKNPDSLATTEVQKNLYQKSKIIRRSESSTTEGFGITFLDVYAGGQTDTIRIRIPVTREKPQVTESSKSERKFLDFISTDTTQVQSIPAKNEAKEVHSVLQTDTTGVIKGPANGCRLAATSDDFFLLRKIMAAETTDDNMISEAKKIFREKCFTTEQIRNLSVLFLTDEGKYRFFDVAYPVTLDREKFATLQSELKDSYYINRFRAMLY